MSFEAASLVRGIVYHLMDENLAREVSNDTVQKTIERLTTRATPPSIHRSRWHAMTNPQRLEWLLEVSGTMTLIGENNTAVLRPRRGK